MKFLQELFSNPTAQQMAQTELAQAHRDLLTAESGQEYAKRMVEYHRDRIRRLGAYVEQGGVKV